jgi:hypothetical protein
MGVNRFGHCLTSAMSRWVKQNEAMLYQVGLDCVVMPRGLTILLRGSPDEITVSIVRNHPERRSCYPGK